MENMFTNQFFLSEGVLEDFFDMNEEEQREFLRKLEKNNRMVYLKKLKELKAYKETAQVEKKDIEVQPSLVFMAGEEEDEEDDKCDITFYSTLLKGCKDESEYLHVLPKKSNPQFLLLMNLLIGEYLKELHGYEMLALEDSLSKEDEETIEEELKKNQAMIDYLIYYRDSSDPVFEEETKNQMIYLQSLNQNYYALSDLKKIDMEYYDGFLELLESIQNGTFKRIKVFTNDVHLNGLLEVRGYQTRIIFKRMKDDVYAILSLFIKKSDNEKSYRMNLHSRMDIYNSQKDLMKSSLDDQGYVQANENVTEEIKRILRKEC